MSISFVIPVYSERENLQPLHEKLTLEASRLSKDYEIIFVDDGSSDNSFDEMLRLKDKDSHIKTIKLRKNYGKAIALAMGFSKAQGDIIITLDADLQDDPAEIPKLIQKIESGRDLVIGWRRHREDMFSKRIASKIFNSLQYMFFGLRIHDANCGLKAMRKKVTKIKLYGGMHRYMPAIAKMYGFRVDEVEVLHHPRLHSKSKYGFGRILNGFLDLISAKFIIAYASKPLHIFGSLGIISAASGLAISAYLSALHFLGEKIGDRPLLMLGVLLIVMGIQLFSLGLIGELITNQHHLAIGFRCIEGDYVEKID